MAVLSAERGILRVTADILSAAVPILSIVWILSIPQRLAFLVYPEQVAAVMLGAAPAVVFYRNTRPARPALLLRCGCGVSVETEEDPMTAMNVVHMRVKAGREDEFLAVHRAFQASAS